MNPDAVLALIMHKIMRAGHTDGPHEARLLLRDWLVLLALNYHRNTHTDMGPAALLQQPVGGWLGGCSRSTTTATHTHTDMGPAALLRQPVGGWLGGCSHSTTTVSP